MHLYSRRATVRPHRPTKPEPFIPLHLHCAHALTTQFSPEHRCLRAQTVLQAGARMPALAFHSTYGHRWYVDIVALPNNALRRQLFDAYTMANALAKMANDVATSDLARVYGWLGTLDLFLRACFEAEERFLYPLVERASRNSSIPCHAKLLPTVRAQAKVRIVVLLQAAMKTRIVTSCEIRGRITALRYALDQFSNALLAYFAAKEACLPKLFLAGLKRGESKKWRIERRFFSYLLGLPHGGLMGALVLQCIENKETRVAFIQRNIRKRKERSLFQEHIRTVENRHMRLPSTFDSVAAKYERLFSMKMFMETASSIPHAGRGLDSLGEVFLDDAIV